MIGINVYQLSGKPVNDVPSFLTGKKELRDLPKVITKPESSQEYGQLSHALISTTRHANSDKKI